YLCVGDSFYLQDSSIAANSNISKWQYDMGDGTISQSTNPAHIYGNAGTYTISLQIEDANGCKANVVKSSVLTIKQEPNPDFSITNNNKCTLPFDAQFVNNVQNPGNVPINFT